MAKKSKKISSKELTEVKELQNQINTLLMNIGNAELVKNQLVSKHSELQVEWKTLSESLETKYGSVNISLEDGAISDIEKEDASLEKA
jgi:hypothetical protein|tara:strand:- start:2952 stop:3215 length:264 start_codon:yes stop_codon:yes gene_type:complete